VVIRTMPVRLLVFTLAAVLAAPLAQAQNGTGTREQMLEDFEHFVFIRNDELAQAVGTALLEEEMTAVEFVGLVEDSDGGVSRFDKAIRQAMSISSVEPLAAGLQRLFEKGKRDQARDPEQISRNISLLVENQRARMLARDRLAAAGEYAAPQLLQVLLGRANPALEAEVQRLLISMGGDAVMPLCAALLKVDPATKERLAVILGQVGRSSALPYLQELALTTEVEAARAAAERAIQRITGAPFDPTLDPADLHYFLAEDYYNESRSLTRFPGETHQLLWAYEPEMGLHPTPVRTEVFHEARAMELTERALEMNENDGDAMALWLAANFSREIDQPENYDNPAYGDDRHDALFYAVLSGATATQEVLARALEDRDTPLARRAIEALRRSAGGAGIWEGLGENRPLLDALRYPDRRVQYEAALALGAANPVSPFPGADRVVPLLASAIRDASERFALVISTDLERQQELAEVLRTRGFTVLPPARRLEEAAPAIADAPGVDLVVSDLLTDATKMLIAEMREDPRLAAAPLLALLPSQGWVELRFRYQDNPLTMVLQRGISDDEVAEATRQLVLEAAGPVVTEAQAQRYANEALEILNDLAVGGSSAFDIRHATQSLIGALDETSGDLRLRVAGVLSQIQERRAQRALMEAALDASGQERVALLDAVARSAKRYGNRLEDRHVRRLVELVSEAPTTEEATAAAALMGALNLRSGEALPLILDK